MRRNAKSAIKNNYSFYKGPFFNPSNLTSKSYILNLAISKSIKDYDCYPNIADVIIRMSDGNSFGYSANIVGFNEESTLVCSCFFSDNQLGLPDARDIIGRGFQVGANNLRIYVPNSSEGFSKGVLPFLEKYGVKVVKYYKSDFTAKPYSVSVLAEANV